MCSILAFFAEDNVPVFCHYLVQFRILKIVDLVVLIQDITDMASYIAFFCTVVFQFFRICDFFRFLAYMIADVLRHVFNNIVHFCSFHQQSEELLLQQLYH